MWLQFTWSKPFFSSDHYKLFSRIDVDRYMIYHQQKTYQKSNENSFFLWTMKAIRMKQLTFTEHVWRSNNAKNMRSQLIFFLLLHLCEGKKLHFFHVPIHKMWWIVCGSTSTSQRWRIQGVQSSISSDIHPIQWDWLRNESQTLTKSSFFYISIIIRK